MVNFGLVIVAVKYGINLEARINPEDIGREALVAELALRELRQLQEQDGEKSPRCIS